MKTTEKKWTRILAQALIVAMLLCALPFAASAEELPQSQATFTFTDQAIRGEGAVLANEIAGTTLTIKQPGVYTLTGSCAEGNVIVAKNVTGVILILKNLTLVSAKGAPISVEAKAEARLFLLGTNALENKTVRPAKAQTPAEPAAAEAAKEAKAPAFVGAAIKVKSNAKLVITGDGALFLNSTVNYPINCAKNAKATLKGGVNFAKKSTQKAKKAADKPAAEATAPAAEATQAPAAQTEEGASATVNAKKAKKSTKKAKNKKAKNTVKPLAIKAGEAITVKAADGSVILSVTAPIDAKQVIFASEKLTAKQSYELFSGETRIAKATAKASQNIAANLIGKNNKNSKNNKKNNKKNVKKVKPTVAPAA